MCDVTHCKKETAIGYSAFGPGRKKDVDICEFHWEKHCDDDDKFDIREHFYPTRVVKKKK